nr:hypothetical protein [Streptomyces sp. SID5470]
MDDFAPVRIPRLRRKLTAIPFQPLRSHSFGEEKHPAGRRPGAADTARTPGRSPRPRYQRWLDHMSAGRDNRALAFTSPRLRAHPNRHRMAPEI